MTKKQILDGNIDIAGANSIAIKDIPVSVQFSPKNPRLLVVSSLASMTIIELAAKTNSLLNCHMHKLNLAGETINKIQWLPNSDSFVLALFSNCIRMYPIKAEPSSFQPNLVFNSNGVCGVFKDFCVVEKPTCSN